MTPAMRPRRPNAPLRFFILFLLLIVTRLLPAQGWLDIGAKVMYGYTGFYDKNIASDPQHNYSLRGAPSYGGVVGLNLGAFNGFNLEGLFLNNEQQLDFRDNGDRTSNVVKWENLDLYLLYRRYFENASYIEIGPKMSRVRSTEQTFADQVLESGDRYGSEYYSAVAGFGTFLTGNETMTLKLGMRLEYALTDLVSEAGRAEGYPAFYREYETDTQTRPFRAGIYLELNFNVSRAGKRICGRRTYVLKL